MNEEEAKEKWCPMAAGDLTHTSQNCIASGCMWWVPESSRIEQTEGGQPISVSYGGGCGHVMRGGKP